MNDTDDMLKNNLKYTENKSMIQIAVCDDNKQDILHLKSLLQEILDSYSISYHIQEYKSGESLLEVSQPFHLIFLDIIMNEKNGIEVAKQLYRRNSAVKIIFQTNYGQYCQKAINNTHAFAFLEKPLEKSELEYQIKEFLQSSGKAQDIRISFKNVKSKCDGKEITETLKNIPAKYILYCESVKMQKHIRIVTDMGDYYCPEAMNKLCDRIREIGFEICCQGILVNLERINRVKGYNVILDNGMTLPLSQRRVMNFKERINEYVHDSYKI